MRVLLHYEDLCWSHTNPQLVGKGRKILIPANKGRKTSWKGGIPWIVMNPDIFRRWKESEFLVPPLKFSVLNLVDCAIYPRMYKLLIRADFDGKGLNKNTAESIVSNKRAEKRSIITLFSI
jgi:hypothetical protein